MCSLVTGVHTCSLPISPGGRLWVFALNPLAPYRWRWRGTGLGASEPLSWRRRMRAAGLVPEPVSQGLGPGWKVRVAHEPQNGPGMRAPYRSDVNTSELQSLLRISYAVLC